MPGHLLRRCQQIAVAIFLDECREFDLTPLQYSALAALDHYGVMDQVTLGGAIALDRTTILVVLRRLEARGFVERTRSANDRRSKAVAITAQGRHFVATASRRVAAAQRRILAPLDTEERRRLVALLETIADGNNVRSRAPLRAPAGRRVARDA